MKITLRAERKELSNGKREREREREVENWSERGGSFLTISYHRYAKRC